MRLTIKGKIVAGVTATVVGVCCIGASCGAPDDEPNAPRPSPTQTMPSAVPTFTTTVAPPTPPPTDPAPTTPGEPDPTEPSDPDPTTPASGGGRVQSVEDDNNEDSAYYANCTAARAAGVTPLHPGDPGYSRKLDRDGDGVACES